MLDIGIYIAGNHKNVTPILNYVLSETIQHRGNSKQIEHYIYFFSDSASYSYKLPTLSASESFNDLQCNLHILLDIRTGYINT